MKNKEAEPTEPESILPRNKRIQLNENFPENEKTEEAGVWKKMNDADNVYGKQNRLLFSHWWT